jgi:PKD repeat protein
MPFTYLRQAAVALALLAAAGCTVKNTEAPPLTGPSGLALTLNLNAIPDSISQDGGSQSSVKVSAIGPDGKPVSGLPLRVDMMVNGVAADFGTLSARSIVTNSDGIATVVYTAPPAPPNGVFTPCAGGVSSLPGACVSIVATATATNFSTANPESVLIRLVPTGVILPPAGQPVASFTTSPTPAQMNVPVTFDASASTPGSGATQITSYSWSFGDGSSGTGKTVSHTFTSQQKYNVTLTVTNDRGLTATTLNELVVGAVTAPSANFVFSPAAPQVGQAVLFNADESTAAPGHTLTVFGWNFGDGATASGSIASHTFATTGAYNVVLSIADDTGQKTTKSTTVTVTAGGGGTGGSATTAGFFASPSAPVTGQVVFFNASSSTAATGRTLTKYAWDFGDGAFFTGSTAQATHTFANAGSFTVFLTVTDDSGQTARTSNAVTVAAAGAVAPTASFTSSPSSPGVNQTVFFNASASTAAVGHTLTTYAWDFGDGTTGTGVTSTHSYNRVGTFTVTLVVTDDAGQTKAITGSVNVTGAGTAQIVAAFGYSPVAPDISDGTNVVHFDATPSTGQGTLTYDWTWGDGTAPSPNGGKLINHTFSAPGTYVVRLTVTDSTGATATTTVNVPVTP